MRALLAGLFVFTLTLALVGVIGSHYPNGHFPWWAAPLIVVAMLTLIVGAFFLFNWVGHRRLAPGKSADEQLAELEAKGLLSSESFKARRAFQVEEFEDEGSHYFIELIDGSVLYLNGQYLYYYDGVAGPSRANRLFPCSEFSIRRHKTQGYIVDIVCSGEVLTLDCEAPPFDANDEARGLIPEDGQLFRDRSYEDLRSERLK
ncbi:MAG TPA: hypothetical protein VL361_07425 [Candidatus Limnocylindrales bacterium]|jgi:hypothetical protein|nr:hypothetical protein [Candidatus Limnocylindrales bacterium]